MRYNESRVRQTRQILPHRKDDGEMRKLTNWPQGLVAIVVVVMVYDICGSISSSSSSGFRDKVGCP